MVDTVTPNLQFVQQTIGGNENTWGGLLNDFIAAVDKAIAGTTGLNVAAGGTFALSDAQMAASTLVLTGTPPSDVTIIVPSRTRIFAARNLCGGSANIIVKTLAGLGIIAPRTKTTMLACDAADVDFLRSGGDNPIGALVSNGGVVDSDWANFLPCLGQAVSRTTYAKLFAKIGTRWGAGDGTTTFNLPSTDKKYLRGGLEADVGATLAEMIGPHTHSGSTNADGIHTHNNGVSTIGQSAAIPTFTSVLLQPGGSGYFLCAGSSTQDLTHSHSVDIYGAGAHGHIFTTNNNAGTENRPASATVLFMIRFQ